jgi:hypothetical protein
VLLKGFFFFFFSVGFFFPTVGSCKRADSKYNNNNNVNTIANTRANTRANTNARANIINCTNNQYNDSDIVVVNVHCCE